MPTTNEKAGARMFDTQFKPRRLGFTIAELFVVVVIIAVLIALLLPAVRTSREASRRVQCQNNLKQLALALHNYHDTLGSLPICTGGTGIGETDNDGNANRLSGLVALLPFVEQNDFYDQIAAPLEIDGVTYPAMGPAPWVSAYTPWQTLVNGYTCPSVRIPEIKSGFAPTSYAFSIGDVASSIHQLEKPRGAFAPGLSVHFKDIPDGTANTVMMSEMLLADARQATGQIAVDRNKSVLRSPSLCLRTLDGETDYATDIPLHHYGRGYNWVEGAAGPALFNTILPPNSPSCAVGGTEAVDGIYSVASNHPGGVQASMVDGSVRFITDDIDTGDLNQPPLTQEETLNGIVGSPFGVWGAMGSIAGEETVD